MMRHRPLNVSGFTLIEVLVALSLMAMMATLLIASLQLGGHTWQRVTRTTSGSEDVAQAQAFLRLRLSALYPYESRSTGGDRPAYLEGGGNSVAFTSAGPESDAAGMIRYKVTVAQESGTLEVRYRRDSQDSSDLDSPQWAVERLLPHVKSLAVRFWLDTKDTPGRWVDQWTDPSQVPRLIKIDVVFPPEDRRRWPPLFVEPHVDTPITCQFDIVGRQCRGRG
jgi:general secretion pathway protein J